MGLLTFLAGEPAETRDQSVASAAPAPVVLVELVGPDFERRCQNAFVAAESGAHLVVPVRLEAIGGLERLLSFLTAPLAAARAERALRRSGASDIARYGVSPDLTAPTFLYRLRGAAEGYARTNLLPAATGPLAPLRALVSWWAGCDVSVGGILVVGRKP